MRAAFLLACTLVASSAVGALGCDQLGPHTCEKESAANPTVRYTEGLVEGGVYMSSPWDGELLSFPGGMHYALEHHLGATPRWVQSYLSFDRYGTKTGGMIAQAAGNQVVLLDLNATTVTLANDSCSDYWLLVTAGAGVEPGPR